MSQKKSVRSRQEQGEDKFSDDNPTTHDREDLEKVKRDLLEVREKLLALRENDILSLREKVNRWLAIGIALAVILSVLGIKTYTDISKLINETMASRIDESVGYYDRLSQALNLANNGGCSSAIPIFKELSVKRPDDEVAFLNAVHCFNEIEDYDQGYKFIENLKGKGIFPNRFHFLLSYNNAGRIALIKSLDDPRLEGEALELLQRAEQVGQTEDNPNIIFPLRNLMLLYIARNDVAKAAVYADRIKALNYTGPEWRDDVNSLWFKRLEAKQPQARSLLERLVPEKKGSSGTSH